MSIIDAFNTSEQIIDTSAVARPIEGFPDTVLVTFSQIRCGMGRESASS